MKSPYWRLSWKRVAYHHNGKEELSGRVEVVLMEQKAAEQAYEKLKNNGDVRELRFEKINPSSSSAR